MSLEVGIKGTCTVTADESNSAKQWGAAHWMYLPLLL